MASLWVLDMEHQERKFWASLASSLAALKSTPRTGWMLRGVPAAIAEPIAAHMYESSVLALVLASIVNEKYGLSIDVYKAASIALVHDYAEAYIGDMVKRATKHIGEKVKEEVELEVLREELGEDTLVYRLFKEYVEQESVEARVAKVAETLSTLIQGLRYYTTGYRDVSEIVCSMYRSLLDLSGEDLVAREALSFVETEHGLLMEEMCSKRGDNSL